jgi:hypothetical protein
MPTAPKLVAAVLIGILGYVTANLIAAHLPEQMRIGLFHEISVFLGVLVGWRFLGRRVGDGYRAALGYGVGASAVLVLAGLVVFSGYEMTVRSLRKSYDGPIEGLQGMVEIAIADLVYLGSAEVLGALILGGAVSGVICEFAARRWS